MTVIEYILVFGFVTFYLTNVLLLDEDKVSHHGPWPDSKREVVWATQVDLKRGQFNELRYPVTLFDWVRRVFGLFIVDGDVWHVNSARVEVWTCPVCLSWWVGLFSSIPWIILAGPDHPWRFTTFFILPWALAGIATFIMAISERVEVRPAQMVHFYPSPEDDGDDGETEDINP